MIYRLLHKLFGWHYVSVPYGGSDSIRRVQIAPNGRPYFIIYGDLVFIDKKPPSYIYSPLTWIEEQKTVQND